MRRSWILTALALGACGGGELADETMRRSAEQALDTTSVVRTLPADTAYRLPAFADPPPAPRAAADSLRPPAAAPNWTTGVVERTARTARITTMRDLRVGRNAGFDRMVLGFGEDPVPSFRVEYGVLPIRQCGSGEPVTLEGEKVLLVHLRTTRAHDDDGRVTVPRPDVRPDMPVIRQASIICDFEGEVQVALGVPAAQPYRVLVESAPSRLIIDLQQ